MNYLLANEEAECGLNPNSEDLDAEEDDGCLILICRSVALSKGFKSFSYWLSIVCNLVDLPPGRGDRWNQ